MEEYVESRIMGIDFGKKRIGIALSDPLKKFAYPFITIPNDSNFFLECAKIIKENCIIKIILGIPNEERVSKTSIVENVKKFKNEIEKKFTLEVIFWDETYTSSIAQQRILESVSKKSKRKNKGLLDMNSASIILQEYIDTLNK
jgi:putative Holliday junction resolvase